MRPRIAIVGAGVSGLSAAFDLAEMDCETVVFEKSKGFSGRAASRSRNGCRYDYGANYFKVDSDGVARLIFESLPTDQLCRIPGDIWTFSEDGQIEPGDPEQNAAAKWSYQGGISTLGKLLVEIAELDVRREHRIVELGRSGDSWSLKNDQGEVSEGFDAVLLTAPAPQTRELLESAGFETSRLAPMSNALDQAGYVSQFTVVLNYDTSFSMPGDAYALINSDRSHSIAWLSHENQKAGRVPDGETLLIVQLSPHWTEQHYDSSGAEIISKAEQEVVNLLGLDQTRHQWADTQRWRYALPTQAIDSASLRSASECHLFFAGDSLVGRGRVSRTIETGLNAARQIRAQLGETIVR
ncbi:MAG: FAD-dependent oxidoreductase [Verrucomicrobiota bacterium]